MRSTFEEQLAALNRLLIEMGAQIESAIGDATRALTKRDTALARRVVARDDEVDRQEREIESLCLKLLLRQQPVAADLRLVSSALKMITDMERIADQAADIAEISIYLSESPQVVELRHTQHMAEATAKMVSESIDAFVKRDLSLAREVIEYDDVVDDLFDRVKRDLTAVIQADAANAGAALDLLMIAKYFERIGDHAVNIAQWVVFSITGTHGNGAR